MACSEAISIIYAPVCARHIRIPKALLRFFNILFGFAFDNPCLIWKSRCKFGVYLGFYPVHIIDFFVETLKMSLMVFDEIFPCLATLRQITKYASSDKGVSSNKNWVCLEIILINKKNCYRYWNFQKKINCIIDLNVINSMPSSLWKLSLFLNLTTLR